MSSSLIAANDADFELSNTGASLTGIPVTGFAPVTESDPSLTLVAIVKLAFTFNAGMNVTPASKLFTSAIAPDAVHTPVPALYVEVTAPDVPVLKLPSDVLDNVNVAVTDALSTSLTTMSVRFNGVSSVYDSAADKFVADGASFTAVTVSETVAEFD